MNLYETDFLNKTGALLKEAFKFKKYKAMSPVLAVFTGILMLPIVVASFSVAALMFVLSFIFSVLLTPVKYLHEIVNTEGKAVRHATQTVIYLISWPAVFFIYVLLSMLLLIIFPVYAILSVLVYVWSLGGFKFHLFANKADDISIEVNGRYNMLPLIFVIIGGMVLVTIPIVHSTLYFAQLYQSYMERFFFQGFFGVGGIYSTYISLHSVFAILYSLIGFARYPKVKQVEDDEEESSETFQTYC